MRKRGLPLMGRPLRPAIRPGPGIGPPVVGMLTNPLEKRKKEKSAGLWTRPGRMEGLCCCGCEGTSAAARARALPTHREAGRALPTETDALHDTQCCAGDANTVKVRRLTSPRFYTYKNQGKLWSWENPGTREPAIPGFGPGRVAYSTSCSI